MSSQSGEARFQQAAALLPPALRRIVQNLPATVQEGAEELRLRVGRPLAVTLPGGEMSVTGEKTVTAEEVLLVLEIASRGSIHTALEQVRHGFLTVAGGHRIGVCGSGVLREGRVQNLKNISSVNIRIAKEVRGAARQVLENLKENGELMSTLILSPPGCGKTTLLRDLVRCISDGEGTEPMRVGLVDERGEIAAMENGLPQMDVGRRTDVLEGCPREEALMMLLRGMNPQVLAVDEITAEADAGALSAAAGCGVILLATTHSTKVSELFDRQSCGRLLERGVFRRAVYITFNRGKRNYIVEKLDEEGKPC